MNIPLEIILAPFITIFLVQSIKLAFDGIKGNYNLKNILSTYGGMPSSHSAVVVSLTTMVGYHTGINSATFAVAAIFSIIVIADAMIFRRYVDNNSQAVLKLLKKDHPAKSSELSSLSHKLEHTGSQVLVGGLIGFVVASIIYLI